MLAQWNSRSLDDFPNELLLAIWVSGCEPEPDSLPPCSRRRKDFPCTVRLVNRRWKALIDFLAERSQFFWITRLHLRVDDKELRADLLGEDDSDDSEEHSEAEERPCFAQRIARFRQGLIKSRGSDLAITIDFPDKLWKVSHTELPSRPMTYIRLLLLTMESILFPTYFNQVIVLRMQNSQPHAYCHLMEAIANRWPTANRLIEISFEPGRSLFREEASVSTLINASGGPALRSILQDVVARGSAAMSMHTDGLTDHAPEVLDHRRLALLTIPCGSWLMEAVHLPPAHHLNIGYVGLDGITLLLNSFQINTALRDSLGSLLLGPDHSQSSADPVLSTKVQAAKAMTFPRLQTLSAAELTPQQAVIFFAGSSFPVLQTVELWFGGREVDSGQTEQLTDTLFPPHAPAVSNVNLSIRDLRSFEFWLSHMQVRDWPIETMKLSGLRSPLELVILPDTLHCQLRNIRPRYLCLERMRGNTVQGILDSLDTEILQDLNLDLTLYGSYLSYLDMRNSENCLLLPRLERLVVRQDYHDSFIYHLRADRLDYIVLQFPHMSNHLEPDISTNYLPSVRHLELQLSYPVMPDLWDLLPNIEVMLIKTNYQVDVPRDQDVLTLERGMEMLLDGLDITSGAKTTARFPIIRSLHVSFELKKPTALFQPSWGILNTPQVDKVHERMHKIVENLLKSRRKFGALPLIMYGPILIDVGIDGGGRVALRARSNWFTVAAPPI